MELMNLKAEFRSAADEVYDQYTIEEWIEAYIYPYEKRLVNQWMAREKLLLRMDWPRRPFNLYSNP